MQVKKPNFKKPDLSRRQKFLTLLGIAMLLIALVFGVMKFNDVFSEKAEVLSPDNQAAKEAQEEQQPVQENLPEPEPEPEPEPKTSQKQPVKTETVGPTEGVGTLSWVVNKRRALNPKTYVPPNLVVPSVKLRVPGHQTMKIRSDVATAAQQLFAAAKAAGHDPMLSSGYRSYSYQSTLYNSYVNNSGQAAADTYSARPGHSEHQTGLSFDICNAGSCNLQESFGGTALGQWVAAHAHEHGFIIRYPNGKQGITGYIYEPWHLRYVGKTTAAQIHSSGKTLEEHFGLPAAPTYN